MSAVRSTASGTHHSATVRHDGLIDRFAAQVLRRPDAVAVCFGAATLSYGQLDERANRVAARLAAMDVGPGSVVALCMSRSPELIVGMLGVAKAGAAYLPMDLVYPRERLAFMLEDAEAAVLLTLSGDVASLPETGVRVVCLDTDLAPVGGEADSGPAPVVTVEPQSLAYVIYTSGSTGKPKGCQVTHANAAWYFDATDRVFDFNQDDVWAFVLSPAFDVSGFEIWGALVHGARIVVVPQACIRAPDALLKLLVEERVTILCHTPTAFLQLMRADERQPTQAAYDLRYVFLGGEAIDAQALRPWFSRHGDRHPQLVNMYGPTETTIYVTSHVVTEADAQGNGGSVIGTGLPDVEWELLDEQLRRVPAGSPGELCIGGPPVTRGYLKREQLTAERFIDWRDPSGPEVPIRRLYRTGDLARELPDGKLEYLGRGDQQVKLRGFRIELGEIESTLGRHPAVRACVVVVREDVRGDKRLVAYIVARDALPDVGDLREFLGRDLPDFMVPSAFVPLDAFPQNANGKLDRKALPAPGRNRPNLASAWEPAMSPAEQLICNAFGELLGIDDVGRNDNFFELGGNSLLAMRLRDRMRADIATAAEINITLLFQDPTPAGLARLLAGKGDPADARMPRAYRHPSAEEDGKPARRDSVSEPIAIVAMAGRFPGANDLEAFWENLLQGRDTITRFEPDQLDAAVGAAERMAPGYVAARGVIDGVEDFDADFFGINPRDAELMDPQHRIFLELCWECLERAGHVPDASAGPVGVFAGMHHSTYHQKHLMAHPELIERIGEMAVSFLNEKDYIASRVAHRLNLTGPAIGVNTACSTSLVAISQAVDSLRAGHCDMALAGGASITCPPRAGYRFAQGSIFSDDGCTRAFSSDAGGTVFSDGAVVVLLKRLSDAQADGNPIYAVVRGSAINNDGGAKASFTAPNSDGQAAVIAMAHRNAGVDPRSIGYVEAHGTGTALGDPIEIEGLTRAFRRSTDDVGFCRIGSVKSNVGHLVVAAGGAGLMKCALALAERRIPATLHFDRPNPNIDFERSPFIVNASLIDWVGDGSPRRAGVSSFGVGGTNAHVVLEEAPPLAASEPATAPQLLVLSARTPSALRQACVRLADHLEAHGDENLADVAWTLAKGRKAFAHRVAVVADGSTDAVVSLRDVARRGSPDAVPARQGGVTFMFPGQGATYAGMGRELYAAEPEFRAVVDECAQLLLEDLGFDIRDRMFSDDEQALLPTSVMQPATFVIEYALARFWISRGVRPDALIGHSVGEFVAATVAGVFQLGDALRLVAHRGALMQSQPAGAMLAVRLEPVGLQARLPAGLSIAAENAPGSCVVAGTFEAIGRLQAQLESEDVACRLLRTSHAFHSEMMAPVVQPFLASVREVALAAPTIPMVSTATGDWLDADTARSPEYWARHLRDPVRFAAGLGRLLDGQSRYLLEVGPRATLGTFARQHDGLRCTGSAAVACLGDSTVDELHRVRAALGRLWTLGADVDASAFDLRVSRRRIRLPAYPFERQRFWIEAAPAQASHLADTAPHRTGSAAPAIPTAVAASATLGAPAASGLQPLMDVRAQYLGGVWAELIGRTARPEDNFFDLGGDSLLAVQMANRVERDTGMRIKLIRLGAETLDQIAASLPMVAPAVEVVSIGVGGKVGKRLKRLFGLVVGGLVP